MIFTPHQIPFRCSRQEKEMGGYVVRIGDMIRGYRVKLAESDYLKNLGCVQRMIVKWVLTKQEEQHALD